MRLTIVTLLLIFLTRSGFGQTFLDAFEDYRLERADSIPKSKTRKKIKSFIKSQIIELDTVFKAYREKRHFDFNTADTLFLIYDSPAESPLTSDIIIWSGNDTVSYKQEFETIQPFKYKRIITYKSFLPKVEKPDGYRVVTERDSLLALVSKRNYITIKKLGDNQSINDGSWVDIYVAYKSNGEYVVESCHPRRFMFADIYQKE